MTKEELRQKISLMDKAHEQRKIEVFKEYAFANNHYKI